MRRLASYWKEQDRLLGEGSVEVGPVSSARDIARRRALDVCRPRRAQAGTCPLQLVVFTGADAAAYRDLDHQRHYRSNLFRSDWI